MKKKTINKVIKKKINDWLKSIDDKELIDLLKKNIIVTGGCITSMLLNEEVNDYDIYFKNKETTKAVALYYTKKFNQNNEIKAWVLDGEDLESWKKGNKKLNEFAIGYSEIDYKTVKLFNKIDKEDEFKDTKLFISGMLANTSPDRIKIIINSSGIAEDSDNIADEVEYNIDINDSFFSKQNMKKVR